MTAAILLLIYLYLHCTHRHMEIIIKIFMHIMHFSHIYATFDCVCQLHCRCKYLPLASHIVAQQLVWVIFIHAQLLSALLTHICTHTHSGSSKCSQVEWSIQHMPGINISRKFIFHLFAQSSEFWAAIKMLYEYSSCASVTEQRTYYAQIKAPFSGHTWIRIPSPMKVSNPGPAWPKRSEHCKCQRKI